MNPKLAPRPFPKADLYQALADLNRHADGILAALARMREMGIPSPNLTPLPAKIEEIRSWANVAVLEHQAEQEHTDWAKAGREVRRWEKRQSS